jgi:hypothetical protein
MIRQIILGLLLFAWGAAALGAEAADARGIAVVENNRDQLAALYPFRKNHALVIGIDKYLFWPRLRCAVKDAQVFAAILKEHYGFAPAQVHELYDEKATRENILQRLYALRHLGDDESLVIYYAGHGALDEGTKQAYWIPVEAERDKPFQHLSCNTIVGDCLQAIRARHILLIADSCFAGAFRGAEGGEKAALGPFEFRVFQNMSRWIITSGGVEPVPDTGGGQHSAFSLRIQQFMLGKMEGHASAFTEQELYAAISRMVTETSPLRQVPQIDILRGAWHAGGHFVFVRTTGSGPAPAPTVPAPPPPSTPAQEPALPSPTPASSAPREADTNAISFTGPAGATLAMGGQSYVIPADGMILYFRKGAFPFELSISGREKIYGVLEVLEVNPDTALATFGKQEGGLFKPEHLQAAWQGRPVQYNIGLTTASDSRPIIRYRMSLRPFR